MAKSTIKVDITPSDKLNIDLRDQATGIIKDICRGIVSEAKRLMKLPKSGRLYKGFYGQAHIASAPGEAPAIDSGNLYNKIRSRKISDLNYRVTVPVPYGGYLEFGTKRMKPRPYIRPAISANRSRLIRSALLRSKK